MTAWDGATGDVWAKALDSRHGDAIKRKTIIARFLGMPAPKLLAASILLLVGAAVVAAIVEQVTRRQSTQSVAAVTARASASAIQRHVADDADRSIKGEGNSDILRYEARIAAQGVPRESERVLEGSERILGGGGGGKIPASGGSNEAVFGVRDFASDDPKLGLTAPVPGVSDEGRQVVRRATIELTAKDVRSAFLKASHLVSEAGGEYVQESALTGSDKDLQANLTLRVAVDRLSAVLNELRSLGAVAAENQGGEDVTAQAIDLEARLRNQQRLEKELLGLMDARKDAPLKEVLELNSQISQVRQGIEQLTAQRDRLSRLTSLATILAIFRAEPVPEPPPATQPAPPKPETLGGYFLRSVSGEWNDGVRILVDTLAAALRIIIGGLVWWAILVAALFVVRQRANRRTPAPEFTDAAAAAP